MTEKVILYNNGNVFKNLSLGVQTGMIRYNVQNNDAHVFSRANTGGTDYVELCRINANGLGIGVNNPTNKLHVLGNSYLDGNLTVTEDLNIKKINVNSINNNLGGLNTYSSDATLVSQVSDTAQNDVTLATITPHAKYTKKNVICISYINILNYR